MENKKPTIEKKSSYESLGEEFPNFEETAEYDETQLAKVMSPEEKANVFFREIEGEVQSEAMSDQLKINKLLQAANTIEDALNDVNLELTDDQIDKFTEMILDLRAKAKAKLK